MRPFPASTRSALRVLLVEDSEADATLIVHALQAEGRLVRFHRVDTAEGFQEALLSAPWDVIVSDHRLPQFDALEALARLQESGLDVPFILVSGTVDETHAIAAMKAGAASVDAADIDRFALAAADLNARQNGVTVVTLSENLLTAGTHAAWDTILAGDIFYERDTADAAHAFLSRHAARGATVLIGDPGRSYLPKDRLIRLAEYQVPVTRELEDMEIKRTSVWTLTSA